MECEKYQTLHAHVVKTRKISDACNWRRHCGCIKTSDKLKEILKTFPSPPPPSPIIVSSATTPNPFEKCNKHSNPDNCISAYCTHSHTHRSSSNPIPSKKQEEDEKLSEITKRTITVRPWQIIAELVQLVQLSVTATALALYYLIYCYMQLIYYTLRSALYFHHADGPMKITIGVVILTSLLVGFNLILRMERLIGIF